MTDLVGQTLGHYRIETSLGYGSMGQVFRGKQVDLNRPAAIKVIHNHLATNPTFRDRFIQKAQSIAALKHPHIVEIYEFGEQGGLLYLIMELLTDGTLSTLLRHHATQQFADVEQPPPEGQAFPGGQYPRLLLGLDLVRQVAEGLVAAHTLGIIHRDIKPDNLLLSRLSTSEQGDERYQIKIGDFGLARLPESSGLSMGSPVGTPAYMSPEQCQNKTLDGRSDLYSLGIVLYEVVTGHSPFKIYSFKDAVYQHINTPPVLPQQVCPDLPPIVSQIILRCLAKTPEERYQTGNELTEALEEAINHIDRQTMTPLVTPSLVSSSLAQAPRVRISDLSNQTIGAIEVTREGLIIGSQDDCDLVLPAESVSHYHLMVKWDGHQTKVIDLKSSYGTELDNEALEPLVSRVWEEKQTVSIGSFLLYLEESATSEWPFMQGEPTLSSPLPQLTQSSPLPQVSPSLEESATSEMPFMQGELTLSSSLPQPTQSSPLPQVSPSLEEPDTSEIPLMQEELPLSPPLPQPPQSGPLPQISPWKQATIPSQMGTQSFWPHAEQTQSFQIRVPPLTKRSLYGRVTAPGKNATRWKKALVTSGSLSTAIVILVGIFALIFAITPHIIGTAVPHTDTTTSSTNPTITAIPTTASSQQQTPTPTVAAPQQQIPTPTPPPSVISPAIQAGALLYSTPQPFSVCDKQGGHWTNTPDAHTICNAGGSEMVNTSAHLAIANLDQLAGNRSSWPGQSFIVQVQVSINSNSHGAFGIDFLSPAGDNTQGYFAYMLDQSSNWAFNHYDTQGNFMNELIAWRLRSSISTKLTIDIRIEGTRYAFYINGVDTTGRAVTGTQFADKIVGLAVDTNADVTFSNFAVFALS